MRKKYVALPGMALPLLHRDMLLRTRLDADARALFEQGEEVLATFSALTGDGRLWVRTRNLGAVAGVVTFVVLLALGLLSSPLAAPSVWASLLGVWGVGAALAWRRGARWVMFAITDRGIVECELDRLRRPRRVIRRAPPATPIFLRRRWRWRHVVIGGDPVWVDRSTDTITAWMVAAA